MGVRHIDVGLCNGCNICVDHCPLDVLRLDKATKKAYIAYLRDCQSCFLCQSECPQDAIRCVAVHERRMVKAW